MMTKASTKQAKQEQKKRINPYVHPRANPDERDKGAKKRCRTLGRAGRSNKHQLEKRGGPHNPCGDIRKIKG